MAGNATADDPRATEGSGQPGRLRLFAGLVIAPFAWALQVLVGYGVSAYACYPTDRSLAAPALPAVRTIVAGATVALWILLLAGCVIAWKNWQVTRAESDLPSHDVLQSGDGRSRFMALCGVVVSAGFALVLLFTSVGIVLVPDCGP